MMARLRLIAASQVYAWVILPLLTACESFAPALGQQQHAFCQDEDSDPAHTVSYKTDIVQGSFHSSAKCLPCHDPLGDNPRGYQEGGLDLTSLAALKSGGVNGGNATVVPGQPCRSWLWLKVSGAPPAGSPMPLEGAALSAAQVHAIHDWIAEGAHDN